MLGRSLLGLVTAAGLAVAPAHAETKWDMPTPYPDGNFHTKNIRAFAEDVEKATSGALKIQVHSAGSLFKHPEIKRNVRQSLAPIGEVLISLHANESPIYGVDAVPFLAASYAEARKLYAASRPFLEKRLGEEGLTLLFSVPWPPQGLYAKKEIKSVDDLKGLKFRTYNPGTGRIAALVGAIPVQVEVPDLPTAFATGRVEVTITSGSTGVEARFWDFVSHYHDTQAWIPRNVVFVNKQAFDQLPADQQNAMKDAARIAEERGWKASEQETADRIGQLKANKMAIVEPAPALNEGLRKIGAQIAAEWEASAGSDGKALLEAYRR
jgi:TRAP-type C4-dicarboxylate transport system substrate-binding protein